MPVPNSTVLPASGLASKARQASGMRLCSSGAIHLAHIARGALPNIAPPSSFWLLPSMDQRFIAFASVIACRHGNAAGFDWRLAAYAPPHPQPFRSEDGRVGEEGVS